MRFPLFLTCIFSALLAQVFGADFIQRRAAAAPVIEPRLILNVSRPHSERSAPTLVPRLILNVSRPHSERSAPTLAPRLVLNVTHHFEATSTATPAA